jgi:hypothetical protein
MSAVSLASGSLISLRVSTPHFFEEHLRHRHGRAVISQITDGSPLLDRQDATWIVRAGLADDAGVSFEASNLPGAFLRHQNGAVHLHHNDGTEQFAADATFVAMPGKNGKGFSLSAFNFADHFLRHYEGEVYIAAEGGSQPWDRVRSWTDDVSWEPVAALAPASTG